MNICFVINKMLQHASGGYKMVFEYANRLTERGHSVSILFFNEYFLKKYGMPEWVRRKAAIFLTHIGPVWFKLDRKVRLISTDENDFMSKVGNPDAIIYTAVESVYNGEKYFKDIKNKTYFIQGYENWAVSDEKLVHTYSMGFKNIVISEWLRGIVSEYTGKEPVLIKNPVDVECYRPVIPYEKRKKHSISLLYNQMLVKGFKYAFEAIKRLRVLYPDLSVKAFGTGKRPDCFPDYIKYTRYASQKKTIDIYNSTSVFLCASVNEGYGLTGLEAMACGTALVSTSYKGVLEYASDGMNALLSPVKDVNGLVRNVQRLFDDDDLRIRIARNGVESVRKNLNWEKAVDKFESVIVNGR